jgi:hypothetical protein
VGFSFVACLWPLFRVRGEELAVEAEVKRLLESVQSVSE